ncbi:hypothetical protein ACFOGJ_29450 [Marinibaculum pumilum]|uniref:Uncharacterized protein n=1 Tax=Marinibaculum pumilum TaxID=1766165 RepID=A0ABV7LA64_9PROT
MTANILSYAPLSLGPDLAFKVCLGGRPDAVAIARLYREMAGQAEDGILNTILDRRGAESVADLDFYIDFFQRLRDAGIRRYRTVVIDSDANRPHMAALAQEAAQAVGLDAQIRHAWSEDKARQCLQEMMADS